MEIEIVEETSAVLGEYEKVSIAFPVESVFRVELLNNGLGGIVLTEESVEKPYVKGYDELEMPVGWAAQFNLSNWGFFSAFDGTKRVGGATVAWNTPEVNMLEGRKDLACLWDLRVAPDYRGKGVGRLLFETAIDWAKLKNCTLFKIETQNINVPACRFYERMGCHLGGYNLHAYQELPDEIAFYWYRKL